MSAGWVKSALPPLLGPLPGWALIPLPMLLFHFTAVTVCLALATLLVAAYLTHKGRSLMWTIRRSRTFLRGYKIESRPLGYRRAMSMDVAVHDFDFEKWRNS